MSYLLGIDLGTTGLKTVLLSTDGEVMASAYQVIELSTVEAGKAEQDPEHWWQAVCSTVQEVRARSGVKADKIQGIGLAGQMHGVVVVDDDGRPLHPCITWADARSGAQCQQIQVILGSKTLQQITGNPAISAFPLPKILWLKENRPEVLAKAHKLLLPKDYLRYRLTGSLATDVSDASGTLMFDIGSRQWSPELAEVFGYNTEILPNVMESSAIAGHLTRTAAETLSLPVGIPVVAGAADLACTALAAGLTEPGRVSVTIGTSGQILSAAKHPSQADGRLYNFCHAIPGQYFTLGSVFAAGLSLRWFKDVCGQIEEQMAKHSGQDVFDVLSSLAAEASIGSKGLLFLPHLTGSSTPYLDSRDRGAFVGLTLEHSKAELVRAVMEGITFAMQDVLEVYHACGLAAEDIRVGGGAARSPLWTQMQADIYGQPVVPLQAQDASLTGALILAGVGTGVYKDCEQAVQRIARLRPPVRPVATHVGRYETYYGIYRQLRDALHQVNVQLHELDSRAE